MGDDGCGGCRALPMGTGPVSGYGVTFLRRHDGKERGVLDRSRGLRLSGYGPFGFSDVCRGNRARPMGTGLRRHDGKGEGV